MKKTYWIVAVLLLLVGAGVFGGYRYLRQKVQPLTLQDALPTGSLFLLDVPDLNKWWQSGEEQPITTALESTGIVRNFQQGLAALGLQPDSSANPDPALAVMAGGYITGAGTFDMLLVCRELEKLPKSVQAAEKYEGISLYAFPQGGKTWLEFRYRGLRVGSFSRVLIEDAVRQVQGRNKSEEDTGLDRVRELAGKSQLPTLFVNIPELSAYLGMFASPEYAAALQGLSQFAGWLALDMQVQESSLILSGYASPGPEQQLSRFLNPDTSAIRVEEVLPLNTGLLWRMGGSPEELFRPDFLKATEGVGDPWLSFQGGEWAYALTGALSDSPARASLFVLRLSDPAAAATHLSTISDADGQAGTTPVRHLNGEEAVISLRFGRSLTAFDQAWFVLLGDFLLMAPDRSTLVQAADQHAQSQTLSQDPDYLAFRKRLLPSANGYLYMTLPGLMPVLQGMAQDRVRDSLLAGMESLGAFQPFALQFDRYRDLFLTSGFLDYGVRTRSSGEQLWSLQLDTSLAAAPYFVTDHRDGKTELLLLDRNHQLYLVDRSGKILWKRALGSPILGEIRQIDYYKNDKLQFLFNTAGKLFLIDRNGQDVADYPIALTAGAGAGVSVFDYENKRDYRIFVGGVQENVYGYYQTGKPLPGWSPMKKAGPLAQPILHAVQTDQDFLVLVSRTGKISFKDRKGEDRFPSLNIGAPLLGPLVLDQGGSEPFLIGCDTLGNLCRISLGGQLERLPLPKVNGRSLFALRNLDGTGAAELLTVTDDELIVRDNTGQERWSAKLPDSGPHLWARLAADPGDNLVALWSTQSGEWNVFDANGNPVSGFPMPGDGPFSVGALGAPGERVLIGARDSRVIARKLE